MFIDLTMPLNEAVPVYPGDPKVQIKPGAQLDNDGYLDHSLRMTTHSGTHIDPPAHMIEKGKKLPQFPISNFIGNGVVVDVRHDFSLAAVKKALIKAGDIVLLYTGMSERYDKPEYYNASPDVPPDVAEFLVKKKVKMVGIDMESVDNMPFTIHKKLLNADIMIIENLVNLKQLLGKPFRIYALPLRLEVEAAPARVIAQLTVAAH